MSETADQPVDAPTIVVNKSKIRSRVRKLTKSMKTPALVTLTAASGAGAAYYGTQVSTRNLLNGLEKLTTTIETAGDAAKPVLDALENVPLNEI